MPPPSPPISVTILTRNSASTLSKTLDSIANLPQVILYDTGSTDDTLSIASSYPNVDIVCASFEGFGICHNKAIAYAKYDWILSIDSDETVSHPLQKQLFSLSLDPRCAYRFPRHNTYRQKWIYFCGWYPDRQVRLFHRKATRFTEDAVHEAVATQGLTIIDIPSPILHESYKNISDFLNKMEHYSTLFAQQHRGKCSSSFGKAALHGAYAFFKSYFLKRGFLGGKEGFEISLYNGNTAFYKYLKLWEANCSLAREQNEECADAQKKREVPKRLSSQPTHEKQSCLPPKK